MKKTPDSGYRSQFYEGHRLYRDQIELMLSLFEANGYCTTIVDEDFEYESLDELIEQRGTKPNNFTIRGNGSEDKPGEVKVSFKKSSISVSCYSRGAEAACKAFMGIRDICESHISRLYNVLNPCVYFCVGLGLMALIAILVRRLGQDKLSGVFFLTMISFIFCVLSSIYRARRQGVILARAHAGNLWKRNSDKLVMLIIGACLGGIMTWFATYLATYIAK